MKKMMPLILVAVVAILAFVFVETCFFKDKQIPETTHIQQEVVKEEPPVVEAGPPVVNASPPPVVHETIKTPEKTPLISYKDHGFDDLKKEVVEFCRQLDNKGYISEYVSEEEGSFKRLEKIMDKLAYNPPVVSGETKDLYTLLSNVAHFVRVLGKDNIKFIKAIHDHEKDQVEPLMALAYQYLIKGSGERKLRINIGQLYEYAGYFLDTLGGKSYLYRRDSKTGYLVRYYCILILDRADKLGKNPHGLDIMPHLKLLKDDTLSCKDLEGRNQYIAVLKNIEETTRR